MHRPGEEEKQQNNLIYTPANISIGGCLTVGDSPGVEISFDLPNFGRTLVDNVVSKCSYNNVYFSYNKVTCSQKTLNFHRLQAVFTLRLLIYISSL